MFEEHLRRVLPEDLPHRDAVITGATRHLELITEANQQFNLTRITSPEEAAVKHVLDSVLPWRLISKARRILDAGTGAGFPGIPLALTLPDISFSLAESIGKKARFVEGVAAGLNLSNVAVLNRRAEEIIRAERFDVITGRALAPVERALDLFAPALKQGTVLLLFKGPDAEAEIAEAEPKLRKLGAKAEVALRYDLPSGMGTRTVIRVARPS